jgi:hypothetical protein
MTLPARTGCGPGGVAERQCTGLENRRPQGLEGSNPSPSASLQRNDLAESGTALHCGLEIGCVTHAVTRTAWAKSLSHPLGVFADVPVVRVEPGVALVAASMTS